MGYLAELSKIGLSYQRLGSVGLNLVNANLIFKIPTAAYTIDPATNNPTPVINQVSIDAYLYPIDSATSASSKAPEIFKTYPGIDETQEMLYGKLVNPKTFPDGIGNLSPANATISGRKGIFILYYPIQDALGVGNLLGVNVYGLFREIGNHDEI